MCFGLIALHLLVFLFDLGQGFGTKLESGVRAIHLEHDVFLADLPIFSFGGIGFIRAAAGTGRIAALDHNSQHGCLFAIARLD